MFKMKCVIVDDEPLARRGLESYIRDVPFLEHAGSFGSVMQYMDAAGPEHADLLFLDIELPKISGINFLKSLPQKPVTIITTAYPNYAVESFEADVADYLVKPVSFERFLKSVTKAKEYFELRIAARTGKKVQDRFFFLKVDGAFQKVMLDDLLFAEAMQNYVIVYTHTQKLVSYLTLKALEEYLDKTEFLKISKSNIISLKHIDRIDGNKVTIGNHELIISRSMRLNIMQLLGDRLLKR